MRVIRTPEDRLLASCLDMASIIKRSQDGKYLAQADGKDGLFDTPYAALQFVRHTLGVHDLDWHKVSMDEATIHELEHPRH